MQRIASDMTARQMQSWRKRHAHSLTSGAHDLGVSRSLFAEYLNGDTPIPRTIALLCAAYDRISKQR